MARKMIVISDDNDFVVAAKMFGDSKGATTKTVSTSEWSRGLSTPGFVHSLTGDVPSLVVGQQNSEGAQIIPFPTGNINGGESNAPGVQTMNQLESVAIQNAIQNFKGNLTEAAKALGIGRATLYRKVKLYNIDPSSARRRRAA